MSLEIHQDLLPSGASPLHVAVNNQNPQAVASLLDYHEKHDIPIDSLDKHGRTPLFVALQNGRFESAALLIKAGANTLGNGQSLADTLIRPVYHPLVTRLVSENAKLQLDAGYLRALLHPAAHDGRTEFLRELLETYEVEVDCVDEMKRTALHYASLGGHNSSVELLLRYGATVDLRDCGGSTPLHLACSRGHLEVLEQLLQDWVVCSDDIDHSLNIQDSKLRTCTHVSLYHKQFKVFSYLLEKFRPSLGLDLEDSSGHSICGLLYYYRFTLNLLPPDNRLPYLSIEEATWDLHCAVYHGNLEKAKHALLLAKVDCFDHMQHTPFMLAARMGHFKICEALIDAGADPNLADHTGKDPLYWASRNQHFDVVRYLISLHSINPIGFFEQFCETLHLELLDVLFEYFSNFVSASKPLHWQKWLSLAARNPMIGRASFSRLVGYICPHDWLENLAKDKYRHKVEVWKPCCYPCLSLYTEEQQEEEKKDAHDILMRLKKRVHCKKARKSVIPFKCTRIPPPSMRFRKLFNFKESLSAKSERKWRDSMQWKNSLSFHPLHDAAASGNLEVLDYILTETQRQSNALVETLLFEVKNHSRQCVVEIMARNPAKFGQRLAMLTDKIEARACLELPPKSLLFEDALLYGLLLSSGSRHRERLSVPLPHPLNQW